MVDQIDTRFELITPLYFASVVDKIDYIFFWDLLPAYNDSLYIFHFNQIVDCLVYKHVSPSLKRILQNLAINIIITALHFYYKF